MSFYTYSQNNSGGSFYYDHERGISQWVVVEAQDAIEANYRAGRIGLYFDGVASGDDCDCCGDRWFEAGAWGTEDGTEFPAYCQQPIQEVIAGWSFPTPGDIAPAYIHYLDGRIEPVYTKVRAEVVVELPEIEAGDSSVGT